MWEGGQHRQHRYSKSSSRFYQGKERFGLSVDGKLSGARWTSFASLAAAAAIVFGTSCCLGAHSFVIPTVSVPPSAQGCFRRWQQQSQEQHTVAAPSAILVNPPSFRSPTWTRSLTSRRNSYLCTSSTPAPSSSLSSSHFRTTVGGRLSRDDAQALLAEDKFFPSRQYGDRVGLGRVAQGLGHSRGVADHDDGGTTKKGGGGGGVALTADDPRLAKTYAEFPLSSFDALLDAGWKALRDVPCNNEVTMVDIGSGLARIVLYAALTRGSNGGKLLDVVGQDGTSQNRIRSQGWHIHGIEIASLLHDGAVKVARAGVDCGVFVEQRPNPENDDESDHHDDHLCPSAFSLHLGAAEDFADTILAKADIVFAYSTAFSAKTFSPAVGALILDQGWSQLLGDSCRPGCVAITTDRALDPAYGWVVKDRIEVENPEVWGSTGYIHILEKG